MDRHPRHVFWAPRQGEPEGLRFPPPPSVPHHTLLRRIGSGAYGEVWLARNTMGFYRAVKFVYRSCFDEERPFARELSGIRKFEPVSRSHDGFVDVLQTHLDADSGCFFYVMELADDCRLGQAIDPDNYAPKSLASEISSRRKLAFSECLRLGLALTASLEALHQRGLVHRDIKPANIIFVEGVPKLADIGMVAAVGDPLSEVGTKGFIPPEGPGTPQADVYSLGKVLYEASTGSDSYFCPELPQSVTQYPNLPEFRELNAVIVRACERDPRFRYKSAAAMQADLLVLLHGKSVRRLRHLETVFSRLKRAGALVAAAAAVGAAVGLPILQASREKDREREREIGAAVAYGNKAMDSGDLLGSLPYFARVLELHHANRGDEATDRLRLGMILGQCPKLVQVWREPTGINDGEFSPDGNTVLIACDAETADVVPIRLPGGTARSFTQSDRLETAVYSHNGKWILTASDDGVVCLRDAATLEVIRSLTLPDRVRSAGFTPDDQSIITACRDGRARMYAVKTGELELTVFHGGRLRSAEASHNGLLFATAGEDHKAILWDAHSGLKLRTLLHSDWVYDIRFSPDDSEVVTACADHTATVWSVDTGEKRRPVMEHDDAVYSAEFSPDGRFILTACVEGTAELWRHDTLQRAQINSAFRMGERVTHAAFSPDSRRILMTGAQGGVRVFDLAGVTPPPPPAQRVFTADRTKFVAIGKDGMQLFDTVTERVLGPPCAIKLPLSSVQLNAPGRFALIDDKMPVQRVQVLDLAAGKPLEPAFTFAPPTRKLALSQDGSYLAAFSTNLLEIYSAATHARLFSKVYPSEIGGAIFEPSGQRLALWSGFQVDVLVTTNGQELFPPLEFSNFISDLCLRADAGKLVASCWDDQWTACYAQVWDWKTGKPVSPLLMHSDGVLGCALSPDAQRVGTASEDYTAMIWNLAGKALVPPLRHRHQVATIEFNSNGKWVVTASRDCTARIWSAETGDPLSPPLRGFVPLTGATFLPCSAVLATAADSSARIWPLLPDTRSVQDIVDEANLLAPINNGLGFQGFAGGAAAAEIAWRRLCKTYPSSFQANLSEIRRWHAYAAEESRTNGLPFAADFHAGQLSMLEASNSAAAAMPDWR